MKLFYKNTNKKDVILNYTETEKDAKTLYVNDYTEIDVNIDPSKQHLYKNKRGKVVVRNNKVVEKPKLTEDEKEEQRENFKINVVSKKSRFIVQRCLQKLHRKRIKKEILLKDFKGSHRELELVLTLMTLGDIRSVWYHLKGLSNRKKFVPNDILTFLTDKTKMLLKQNYPKFIK